MSTTTWDDFKSSPLLFFAQRIYAWARPSQSHVLATTTSSVRVVCLSDTHNSQHSQPSLPAGDILLHSGDLTKSGTVNELRDALNWLDSQPHSVKVFIAGNHDSCLADPSIRDQIIASYPSLTYLENSSTVVTVRDRVLRIHGCPYTPKYGTWLFQYPQVTPSTYSPEADPECQATKIWSSVPPLTDILITHGPPLSHLDFGKIGCYALMSALWRVRPRLHVFGHVHAARGVEYLSWDVAQKVYEDICAGKAGWGGLARLLFWTIVGNVRSMIRGGKEGGQTTLVNAAAIGGVRDLDQLGATVVYI